MSTLTLLCIKLAVENILVSSNAIMSSSQMKIGLADFGYKQYGTYHRPVVKCQVDIDNKDFREEINRREEERREKARLKEKERENQEAKERAAVEERRKDHLRKEAEQRRSQQLRMRTVKDEK